MGARLKRFGYGVSCAALVLTGCATDEALLEGDDSESPTDLTVSELTGANAVGRNATVQSYVLVRVGASDAEIQRAAVQQLRPLFGAMKAQDIGLANRLDSPTATSFIDVSTFVRDTVDVIDPAHPETRVSQMQRVRFTYRDRAVVNLRHKSRRAWSTSSLFGDYSSHASELVEQCQSEHQDWGASGIWYNFEPHLSACQSLINAEVTRLAAERRRLRNGDREITVGESTRWFTPITIKLTAISRTETKYPDYHRIWDDGRLVIGAYFGEDKHDDANDYGARNLFQYVRAVLQARPELRASAPGTDLTTVSFGGATISNVTPLQVAEWIVDKTNYPTQVPFAMRDAFRLAVIRQWRDKTITFAAPVSVSINGAARTGTAEVRVFYGDEEGSGSGAVQRYQAGLPRGRRLPVHGALAPRVGPARLAQLHRRELPQSLSDPDGELVRVVQLLQRVLRYAPRRHHQPGHRHQWSPGLPGGLRALRRALRGGLPRRPLPLVRRHPRLDARRPPLGAWA
ncbi:MAG: hypothetical protein IPF99_40355 [Deltaproteobacteria bacterium]|nr:hypothetical protein [Deltaproteobacteria bacterium]